MPKFRSLMLSLLVATVPAVASSAPAGAPVAPYRWRDVAVGAGGFAPAILFSRAERGLAYLRTDMGGAYRWDMATARWIPLQDGTGISSYFGIESLAADPVDPAIVYLAAGMSKRSEAAIWRSADRGATWDIVPVPFRMGGNEDGRGLGERLAIDPRRRANLWFGSRHDGLWRSTDSGRRWTKVAGFPLPGLGVPEGRGTHAGLSFVLPDPSGDGRRVYVASADPGARHLFRSDDDGAGWTAVAGGPPPALLPVKAAIADDGMLYITYADGIGPNGITAGAVWRLDRAGRWTDITPDPRRAAPPGGYMGIALGRDRPGVIAVTSINRWQPGDTVWRSTDGGAHWQDLRDASRRDLATAPWLDYGRGSAEFGHWTAGLGVDPFDAGHVAYTTGATVYATDRFGGRGTIRWAPWVRGIEQTAIISLASPTGGAPLLSGFGDIGGFVHDDLSVPPPRIHLNPLLTNTNMLDYAGLAPAIVVRSGNVHGNRPLDASMAWSQDGGHRWTPLRLGAAGDPVGNSAISVSADGRIFLTGTPTPLIGRDHGARWMPIAGLPRGTRPITDKQDPARAYAIDFAAGRLYASHDGGATFAPVAAAGLPADLAPARPRSRETPFPLLANPDRAGDLWLTVAGTVYRSTDGGHRFVPAAGTGPNALDIRLLTLGKGPAPDGPPTLFAFATRNGVQALWRSTDGGGSWVRINDDDHRWANRIRVIQGDPRRFGRLYVGTDGRGIVYGDAVP